MADAVKAEDFRRLAIEIAGDIATFLDASRAARIPNELMISEYVTQRRVPASMEDGK